MGKSVDLNQLELTVKQELEKIRNITVEISDLSESAYRTLVGIFEEDYEVCGIVNVFGIDEDNKKGKYTLHISRGYEDA